MHIGQTKPFFASPRTKPLLLDHFNIYYSIYEPVREISIPIAYAEEPSINTHADESSQTIGLNFALSLYLHPYVVHVSSEGSGESVHVPDSPEPPLFTDEIISCTGPHCLKIYPCKLFQLLCLRMQIIHF